MASYNCGRMGEGCVQTSGGEGEEGIGGTKVVKCMPVGVLG